MDEFTHGGTPPTLWPKVRAPRNTSNYQSRITALARQVEKLSWMVEELETDLEITLEEAEGKWQSERASQN